MAQRSSTRVSSWYAFSTFSTYMFLTIDEDGQTLHNGPTRAQSRPDALDRLPEAVTGSFQLVKIAWEWLSCFLASCQKFCWHDTQSGILVTEGEKHKQQVRFLSGCQIEISLMLSFPATNYGQFLTGPEQSIQINTADRTHLLVPLRSVILRQFSCKSRSRSVLFIVVFTCPRHSFLTVAWHLGEKRRKFRQWHCKNWCPILAQSCNSRRHRARGFQLQVQCT